MIIWTVLLLSTNTEAASNIADLNTGISQTHLYTTSVNTDVVEGFSPTRTTIAVTVTTQKIGYDAGGSYIFAMGLDKMTYINYFGTGITSEKQFHNIPLQQPFFFSKNSNGAVTNIYHVEADDAQALHLKFGIASAFSYSAPAQSRVSSNYTAEEEDKTGYYTAKYSASPNSEHGNSPIRLTRKHNHTSYRTFNSEDHDPSSAEDENFIHFQDAELLVHLSNATVLHANRSFMIKHVDPVEHPTTTWYQPGSTVHVVPGGGEKSVGVVVVSIGKK